MHPLLAGFFGILLGIVLAAAVGWLRTRRVQPPAPAEPAPSTAEGPDTTRLAAIGGQLAAVAHELGGPMTAILAFSEDMLQAEPTVEQREALLVIRHQARRSRLLLRGLLESARGGEAQAPDERVDVAPLLERVVPVFRRECERRGLDFQVTIGESLPPLAGDAHELEQVLSNVLQNACHATPPGGKLTLDVQVRGRLLEFEVRDTGPGVPADVLPKIFEPFYTTKPAGEGTGLGLAVSQGIVRRHRGIMTAENLPGGGARFVIALPFEDRRWRDRDMPLPDPVPTGPASPDRRRLLLVEDQDDVRTAMGRFLQRKGWEVEALGDGRAALAQLLTQEASPRFDAVVCDVRIPGMSGIALYERVRGEAPEVARRMVLMTGDAGAADVATFRERTGAPVLEKPFELTALMSAIETAAGGERRVDG